MRHLTLTAALTLCASLALGQSANRQVISSIGGSGSAGSLQVSHTLGQPFSGSASVGSIVLTQGFEQHDDNKVSLPEEQFGDMAVYPNPTDGQLTFEAENLKGSELHITVHDLSGQVMMDQQWNNLNGEVSRQLSLEGYATGEYLLRVQNDQGHSQTFSVIKK